MDIPSELKPDLHKALLGSLSMADEIYGALLPGCILVLLLVLKENSVASRASAYPYWGYKTKMVCGLLATYFIGKVSMASVTLSEDMLRPKTSTLDSTILKDAPQELIYLLGRSGGHFYARRTVTDVRILRRI